VNTRHSDYITKLEQLASDQIALVDRMQAMVADWTAQDLGNTMDAEALAANNVAIANVTGAVVTFNAVISLMGAGHRLNLLKVRR
jgi:hypothetical protein